jgi:hypothetical protein
MTLRTQKVFIIAGVTVCIIAGLLGFYFIQTNRASSQCLEDTEISITLAKDFNTEEAGKRIIQKRFDRYLDPNQCAFARLREYRIDTYSFRKRVSGKEFYHGISVPKPTTKQLNSDHYIYSITYSLKPEWYSYDYWAAGNGVKGEDGWLVNKSTSFDVMLDGDTFIINGVGFI